MVTEWFVRKYVSSSIAGLGQEGSRNSGKYYLEVFLVSIVKDFPCLFVSRT